MYVMDSLYRSKGRHLLFGFLRFRWRAATRIFLFDLSANFLAIALSFLLAQAIASTFGFRSVRGSLLGLLPTDAYVALCWLGGLLLLKFLLDYFRMRWRGQLVEDFSDSLRRQAFSKHLQMLPAHHEKGDAGQKLLRFSGDLSSAQRLLGRGILQFLADFSLLLLGLGLIAYLHVWLALLVIGLLLVACLPLRWSNQNLRTIETQRRNKKAKMLAFISQVFHQLTNIQGQNRSTRIEQRFDRKSATIHRLGHEYHRWAAISEAIPLFLVQILLAVVLLFGVRLGVAGDILFAILLVMMSWRNPLSRLLRVGLVWKKGIMTLEKMDNLLQSPQSPEGGSDTAKNKQQMRLVGLGLNLDGTNIFQDVNISLSQGEKVGLYLPTGGGKTVMAKVLAGIYAPTAGHIEWDRKRADQFSQHSLRRQMSFISYAFPLVGDTLVDALSKSGQKAAIEQAETEFRHWQSLFPSLKHLDIRQRIFDHATHISAGQQMLLQGLRTVLSDKPFWVLDEPFAHLDADTAHKFAQALLERSAKKGVLLLSSSPDLYDFMTFSKKSDEEKKS